MTKTITTLLLFMGGILYAQEYTITGSVADETSKEALEAATIYAENPKDSTMLSYTITDQKGVFELKLKSGNPQINVFITYNGYETLKKEIALSQKKIDLGAVLLGLQLQQLEGVDVVAERAPIAIKKDTLEFNANSFKTRPDANVEDLIKKLPGVEVDTDGKITVNGKEVNRVLVNGKSFFGDDPKIATKNLPKEIVDKIQVTDTKSETEEFTGKESKSENKTINITIKEDKNKGYFGRLTAGYGTDDRYDLSGIVNYFNNKQRISVLGSSNNVNSSGFSFDEVFNTVGRRAGNDILWGNQRQGITTSSTLGGSFADELKDKSEITADYFYATSDSYNDTKTSRENILPDRRYFTNSTSRFDGEQDSHKANMRYEFELDSTLKVTIAPSFNYTKNMSRSVRDEASIDEDGNVINTATSDNISDASRKNFRNQLDVIKKFGSNGSFVKFGLNNDNSVSDSDDSLLSENNIFGDNPSQQLRNQITNTDNRSDGWTADVELRQALAKKLFLDVGYSYSRTDDKTLRNVFDFNDVTEDYTDFNTALSSDFKFRNIQQKPSVGVNYEGEKYSLGLGASYVNTALTNNDALQGGSFDKDFDNVLFNANARFRPSRNKNININYNANTNVPSVSQLQPIDDVSNPLNIITGNPNLKPAINHNLYVNFNNFDWQTRSGMFLYGGVNFFNDRITTTTVTDENFVRRTTYTNVSGSYSGFAGAHYSKQVKKDSTYTLRTRISINGNINNNVNFNNGVEFSAKTLGVTPRLSFNFNYRELIDFNPGYSITLNNTSYSLDTFEDINFVNHNFELQTTTYWPKNIVWGNDITYTYNGSISGGFEKSAVFWNMSLGLKMFKDKGNLKIIAYDLLDQNINTRRTATEDYIQDTQGTVLEQYFMMSFTFKFDQFGGKGGPPGGRGGRPQFIRF